MSRPAVNAGNVGLGVLLLLIGPSLAVWLRGREHAAGVAAGVALISGGTFLLYRFDKRRAEKGRERVPESTLHLFDGLGGWPGGLLAQRWYRHKTAKGSFQFWFWLTVTVHQAVAIDALLGWKMSRALAALLR